MAADTAAGQTELAEFGILGPLEVSRSGGAVPLGGPRQRAVLALLLLEANRVVSMDRLAEDLWAGHPPEGWVTTVQIYVSHLRQALEPDRARGAAGEVLVTRGRGYLLRVDGGRLDAARFQDGFTAGRAALEAGRYAQAAGTLRQALGLWRGGVLADLADYAFTRPEAARLEELRLAAVEARIDADLALGRHDALTAELEQLAARASAAGAAARPADAGAVPVRPAGRRAGRLPAGPRPARRRARHRSGGAAAAPARSRAGPGPGAGLGTVTVPPRSKLTALTPTSWIVPRRLNRVAGRPGQAVAGHGRGGAAGACWSSARRWRSPRPRASSPWPGRGRAGRPACRPTAWA